MRILPVFILLVLTAHLHGQHVVFEDVGHVATSLSYLHVTLPLNLTGLQTLLDDYKSALFLNQTAIFNFYSHTDDFYDKRFDNRFFQKVIDPALQDFAESLAALQRRSQHFDGQLRNLTDLMPAIAPPASSFSYESEDFLRKKRFAPFLVPLVTRAVFGTIHGLYTKAKYDKLRSELNTVISQQNRLITASRTQDDAINSLQREATELQQFFGNLTVFAPLKFITKLRNMEMLIQGELDRLWDAVQEAQHHRLSIRFLPAVTLDRLFKKIKSRAQMTGNTLLLDKPSDLFQIELSYCYDGSEITLILHVPMAPRATTLRLLKFLPFPFQLSKTHFLLPSPAKRLLAISSDEPRLSMELTEAELEGCYRVSNLYLCERQGVLKSRMSLTCLGSLYDQQFRRATEMCDMKATPIVESVLQLNDNWFLVYSVKQFTAYITCRNSSSSEYHVSVGVNKIPVSPSCSVKLQDHVLHADTALRDTNDIIQFSFSLDGTAFTPDEVRDAEDILENLDADDDQDPSLDTLRAFKSVSRKFPGRWWFYILAIIVIAIALSLLIFGSACVLKYRVVALSLRHLADKVWPRRTHEDIYDIAYHEDDFEEEVELQPLARPDPMRQRASTLPRHAERPVDVLPPAPQPVQVVHQVQVHRPVLRPRPSVPAIPAHAVDFIRSASRRLRQRGGQPDSFPDEFKRHRKQFH